MLVNTQDTFILESEQKTRMALEQLHKLAHLRCFFFWILRYLGDIEQLYLRTKRTFTFCNYH